MKKMFVITAVAAALTAFGSVHAAGDAAAGKDKSAMCAGCHGVDGNSPAPTFPKLAGQAENYLLKQLVEFKSGVRPNATMAPMVAGLSEQDMADLAAYYASQTPSQGQADPALVELGQKIYRGGDPASGVSACTGCHGPAGSGNPAAKFPALAGQHADYVAAQLKAFRAGERANDAGTMMTSIASRLTDAQIGAVASYVQGLR